MSFTCLAFSLASLNLGNYSRASLLGLPVELDVSSAVTPCSSTIENHAHSGSFMVSLKASSKSHIDLDTSDDDDDGHTHEPAPLCSCDSNASTIVASV
ncbi:hypothetical protein SPRG_16936 [Saprolegnia parasitica CBS 223.65]|uniref:Uncharacterized protein n=1 Tax=Saprolegnia parasitica (strain CBS 223.65) TaxID=695850 RepID=A0A067BRZ1_SAPPC|nr:hypothetical protein SPRG_16936 [Saprolegnia parasitica CBS 223.65]KDO17442.1 hypothetical protein SPRG_16936 [Saprolegnia parasitica CBS 223.65]|eukprot:XP_012211850.1 hypothetical protein SPRG_16936 [Saprolegnia parasitica CBS 223.65]